jgi:LPXTG-motif cell wall-anchored protein
MHVAGAVRRCVLHATLPHTGTSSTAPAPAVGVAAAAATVGDA